MNFVKNFKWQIVLVALGATLMMSGKAYSQEISNTVFSTPPTSASGNFNTPAPYAAANTAANSQTAMTPTPAMAIQPATQLEGVGAEGLSLTAGPLLAIGIIIVGGVVIILGVVIVIAVDIAAERRRPAVPDAASSAPAALVEQHRSNPAEPCESSASCLRLDIEPPAESCL